MMLFTNVIVVWSPVLRQILGRVCTIQQKFNKAHIKLDIQIVTYRKILTQVWDFQLLKFYLNNKYHYNFNETKIFARYFKYLRTTLNFCNSINFNFARFHNLYKTVKYYYNKGWKSSQPNLWNNFSHFRLECYNIGDGGHI